MFPSSSTRLFRFFVPYVHQCDPPHTHTHTHTRARARAHTHTPFCVYSFFLFHSFVFDYFLLLLFIVPSPSSPCRFLCLACAHSRKCGIDCLIHLCSRTVSRTRTHKMTELDCHRMHKKQQRILDVGKGGKKLIKELFSFPLALHVHAISPLSAARLSSFHFVRG